MQRSKWFERKFPPVQDNGLLPGILERLEGTPARIQAKMGQAADIILREAEAGKWSIKKEIGHLADLEPLWYQRVLELQDGAIELQAADLTNRKTHEARHDQKSWSDLLEEFSSQRKKLVNAIRQLNEEELNTSSLHPRLKTHMKVVDLAFFVAEHDDHHLAAITELIRISGVKP